MVSARANAKGETGNHVVPYVVLFGAGLGGADAPGEGGFWFVCHGSRLLLLGRATDGRNRKRSRRRFSVEVARRSWTGRAVRLCRYCSFR